MLSFNFVRKSLPDSSHHPLEHNPKSSYQPLDRAAPPTKTVAVVSPKAVMPNGDPPKPSPQGMPCKRTIFPPPRDSISPSTGDSLLPSGGDLVSPSRQAARTGLPQDNQKTREALLPKEQVRYAILSLVLHIIYCIYTRDLYSVQ